MSHPSDLTGIVFGNWTVVERDLSRKFTEKNKTTYWICKCSCGKIKSVRRDHLCRGDTTSCGCKFLGIDIKGQKFGRLTVMHRVSLRGRVFWWCECECGELCRVESWKIRKGETTSCGCYHKEVTSAASYKHGQSLNNQNRSKSYNAWSGMIQRCTNTKCQYYYNYGGRGIYVCERWLNSAQAFLNDMGKHPGNGHSIDRINNNGNYTCGKCKQCKRLKQPMNCRWASAYEQSLNRRTNKSLTHQGRTMTVKEWSNETGLKRSTIEARLKLGWSVKRTLTTPLAKRRPR